MSQILRNVSVSAKELKERGFKFFKLLVTIELEIYKNPCSTSLILTIELRTRLL